MDFEVTLIDDSVELVEDADSFTQEGPLTTFFGTDGRRPTLDSWSVKVASFRTDHILKIRRLPVGEGRGVRAVTPEVRTFANAS